MRIPIVIAVSGLVVSMAGAAFAAERSAGTDIKGDAICPATVHVTQEAASTPAGYLVAKSADPTVLAGLTIFDGPPKDLASLVPDNADTGSSVATWTIAQDRERGLYVSCIYSGTRIQLQRKLPASVTSCRVTYDNNVHVDGYPQIKSMSCK
ncbi:MAG TPA: STY0301 family protein [Candidatus Binatia bacterium]|jgi:hypothetical protein